MKTLKIFVVLAFLATLPLATQAQKARVKAKKAAPPVVETPGQRLYKTMLPATAKVMFIDSVVVSKADFLAKVPLNGEAGKLSMKVTGRHGEILGQYENDFGDRKIFAVGDTAGTSLYTQTLLGDGWSEQTGIDEIDEDEFSYQNYPFLSTDGVTLYFSAKGPNSMGGRDIFMTTFDRDKGKWYEPENYGLPYNSTANDYLLAIDDLDSLGWLVTDRHQPHDSVCIYTFVPTYPRLDFAAENLSAAQLEGFAKISSISKTWKFGDRRAALRRRDAMLARTAQHGNGSKTEFVVNDDRVISSASDFRSAESRNLFKQLEELRSMLKSTQDSLDTKRLRYAKAGESEKAGMRNDILSLEKDVQRLYEDIKQTEKRIRNLELGK